MIIKSIDQLVDYLAKEIINELDSIFSPVGGFAEFVNLINSVQANKEKIPRPVLYPLVMPEIVIGKNHR